MTDTEDFGEIVGTDGPVNRTNPNHPLTGRPDTARNSVGDRRRIEQLEYELGRVICGYRSRLDAKYCQNTPLPNNHRCQAHQTFYTTTDSRPKGSTRYSPQAHKYNRCSRCAIKPCDGRVLDAQADDCVYEIEQFEDLMEDAAKLTQYGPTTQHLFRELVWTLVVIGRLERQVAVEGMTVTHIDGAINSGGVVEWIKNDSEHPVLKHLSKLQQSARQLASDLELTPKSLTGKGVADDESNFKKRLGDLWKESVKAYAESKSTTKGD